MDYRLVTLTITRKADKSLHFDPPPGSQEIADALSYHFPGNNSLEEKMKEAIAHALAVEAGLEVQRAYFFFTSELTTPGFMGGQGLQDLQKQSERESYSPKDHLTPPAALLPRRSLQERNRPRISPNGQPKRRKSTSGIGSHKEIPGTSVLRPEGSFAIKKGRKGKLTDAQRESAKINRLTKSVCEKHRTARTKCDPEKCPGNALYGAVTSRRTSGASSSMLKSPMIDNKQSPSSISSGYFPHDSHPGSVVANDPSYIPNNQTQFQQQFSISISGDLPITPGNYTPYMTSGPPLGHSPYELTGLTQSVTEPAQSPNIIPEYTVTDSDYLLDAFIFDADSQKDESYLAPQFNLRHPHFATQMPQRGLASSYYDNESGLESRPASMHPTELAAYDIKYLANGAQTSTFNTSRSPKKASKSELRARKFLEKLERYFLKLKRTFNVGNKSGSDRKIRETVGIGG